MCKTEDGSGARGFCSCTAPFARWSATAQQRARAHPSRPVLAQAIPSHLTHAPTQLSSAQRSAGRRLPPGGGAAPPPKDLQGDPRVPVCAYRITWGNAPCLQVLRTSHQKRLSDNVCCKGHFYLLLALAPARAGPSSAGVQVGRDARTCLGRLASNNNNDNIPLRIDSSLLRWHA